MNLNDYKNRFNFDPPDEYVAALGDKVMSRIHLQNEQEKRKSARRSCIVKIAAWATAAAAVATGLMVLPYQHSAIDNNGTNSIYEDYATYTLIESCNTYSLCDYFYSNIQPEPSYSAAEFADYGHRLSGDIIIEGY